MHACIQLPHVSIDQAPHPLHRGPPQVHPDLRNCICVCPWPPDQCSRCKTSGWAQVLPPVLGYKKRPLEEAIQELDKLAKY